jgi:cell division protein FtsL
MLIALPLLWLAVLGSAIAVVRARPEARALFVQLEQSAWSNHGFVERVASERLRMTLPEPGEVRIVAQ